MIPVELAARAVSKRAEVVSVPLTMLNVAVAPDTLPTWLSLGELLMVVVVRFGALVLAPKLNVPLLISKAHGTVTAAELALSIRVQSAALSFSKKTLVPPGLADVPNLFTSSP